VSLPKYAEYKPTGLPLTPMAPSHWRRTALKYLGDYQNGYPFKPEDRGEEGLPIIRISQLTSDDEPAYFKGELDQRVKIAPGDLLFSWSATIDSYIWSKGDAWLNQHIFKVTESQEASKDFLYYVIKHIAPKLADFDAHGSTMRHIKKESLGEKLYIPLQQEQLAIATFLDRETAKIDALIAEQQRLIELLQEKRQAVISHAVTKGLSPNAPMKDSGVEWLGEVPEHWEAGPMCERDKAARASWYSPREGPQSLEIRSTWFAVNR
jgi:type I restriction enzyme, S subunit